MRILQWYQIGETIPHGGEFKGKHRKVVTCWTHGSFGDEPFEWHWEYLYEVNAVHRRKDESPRAEPREK